MPKHKNGTDAVFMYFERVTGIPARNASRSDAGGELISQPCPTLKFAFYKNERDTRIELASLAWEASVLPLY